MLRLLTLILIIANLTGCAGFFELKRDLKTYRETVTRVSGTLGSAPCPNCMIVVVVLDRNGKSLSYKVFEHPGPFDVLVSPLARSLFSFHDVNHDVAFNPGEAYAWQGLPDEPLEGRPVTDIVLNISAGNPTTPNTPYPQGSLFELRNKL